jgi:hypothetical protein
MRQSSVAACPVEGREELEDISCQDVQRQVPPDARPWGFIRRGTVPNGEDPVPMESDVSLWLDRERYRFLVVADKVVKDDLAPIEFVQFVRELRHSTTQILFKYEIRLDGSVGRPFSVWF